MITAPLLEVAESGFKLGCLVICLGENSEDAPESLSWQSTVKGQYSLWVYLNPSGLDVFKLL